MVFLAALKIWSLMYEGFGKSYFYVFRQPDPSQFPAERVMFVLGTAVGLVTCIIQQSLQKHANWSQMLKYAMCLTGQILTLTLGQTLLKIIKFVFVLLYGSLKTEKREWRSSVCSEMCAVSFTWMSRKSTRIYTLSLSFNIIRSAFL